MRVPGVCGSVLALLAFALTGSGCTSVVTGGAAADAPTIGEVAIAGNNQVDDDDIVDGLANRPPERDGIFRKVYRRLDRLALEQDISRIEAYYHLRGFYSAKVIGTDIQPAEDKQVRVTFQVSEGQPTRISGLSILGLSGGLMRSNALSSEKDKFRRGKVFRHDTYAEFKDWITNWLAHRGFPHGRVEGEVDVDRDAHTADIIMKVDRGPYARFRNTEITGLRRIPESAVRNRLSWVPGESMRLEKLELTQGRLYALGLFSAVRMDYSKEGRPRLTDIRISLTEAQRHELRLGGGMAVSGGFDPADLRIEARQRTSYLMRGVFTPVQLLRLEARPGWEWRQDEGTNSPVGEATATLEHPDLIFPRLVGTASVGFEQSQLQAFVLRGPLGRLGLTRPFLSDDRLQVSLGWRIRLLDFVEESAALDETRRIFNFDPDRNRYVESMYEDTMGEPPSSTEETELRESIGMVDWSRLGALEQTVSYDWRHPNPLNPRWGAYASVTISEGAAALGSEVPFLRGTADVRGYMPILRVLGFHDPFRRLVLAGRAYYGRALGSNALPITERFFDGGASGHRGFTYQTLAPSVAEDAVAEEPPGDIENPPGPPTERARIGGEEHFLASGEIRWDIARIMSYPFGIVLFTDAGDVVSEVGQLKLGKLHYAAGVGLRFEPIIAIRLDFAYRLNRYTEDDPLNPAPGERFAFHFSLGQAF